MKIDDDLFKLRPSQEKFEIENINLDFDQKNYNLKLDKLILNFPDKVISLKKFSFKPTISKFELAQEYRYNDDVYDVDNFCILLAILCCKDFFVDILDFVPFFCIFL